MSNQMILMLMFKNANSPRLPVKARRMGLSITAKKKALRGALQKSLLQEGGWHPADLGYASRNWVSDARASPPLMFGIIFNSSTVTPSRLTTWSSASRVVSGRLNVYCWRTISR